MALKDVFAGTGGSLKMGATPYAVQNWSYQDTIDDFDYTEMGEGYARVGSGVASSTINFTVLVKKSVTKPSTTFAVGNTGALTLLFDASNGRSYPTVMFKNCNVKDDARGFATAEITAISDGSWSDVP